MNKVISISCYQSEVYIAYTNQKIEPPKKIKTETIKQDQRRDPEPIEDLVDYINANPFSVLFSGILRK